MALLPYATLECGNYSTAREQSSDSTRFRASKRSVRSLVRQQTAMSPRGGRPPTLWRNVRHVEPILWPMGADSPGVGGSSLRFGPETAAGPAPPGARGLHNPALTAWLLRSIRSDHIPATQHRPPETANGRQAMWALCSGRASNRSLSFAICEIAHSLAR